ncbi:hypothetical protein HanXRQr2_Chr00c008g0832671 [Helianthus annuus]|uniref:Uncharacterized protein n=1 Tax=Helianthus annuus TaxID=4232 RepID=A0A9K3JYZ8_HELAN|nr:hypothetical protein HanXRQr2_Chr00c008g0832671 [Helianthus annuus]
MAMGVSLLSFCEIFFTTIGRSLYKECVKALQEGILYSSNRAN